MKCCGRGRKVARGRPVATSRPHYHRGGSTLLASPWGDWSHPPTGYRAHHCDPSARGIARTEVLLSCLCSERQFASRANDELEEKPLGARTTPQWCLEFEDSSPGRGDHRVVNAYLFDRRQGESVDDWAESLGLSKGQVLWLDLLDASQEQAAKVLGALDLGDAGGLRLGDPEREPGVEEYEGHLRVTAVAVSDAEHDPDRERVVVDCLVASTGC